MIILLLSNEKESPKPNENRKNWTTNFENCQVHGPCLAPRLIDEVRGANNPRSDFQETFICLFLTLPHTHATKKKKKKNAKT